MYICTLRHTTNGEMAELHGNNSFTWTLIDPHTKNKIGIYRLELIRFLHVDISNGILEVTDGTMPEVRN